MSGDGRCYSPSSARNREPIRAVLEAHLPRPARILEIASGTGEHGAWFTETLDGLDWTYSDIDPQNLASQRAWRAVDESGRLHGPLTIDAASGDWGEAEKPDVWDAVFCANMIHIAPFTAAEGLIAGAARLLRPGGFLILYGPFARNGLIAPSNAAFNDSLRSRNTEWGVRDLDLDIVPLAEKSGLTLHTVVEMPANNLAVFLRAVG